MITKSKVVDRRSGTSLQNLESDFSRNMVFSGIVETRGNVRAVSVRSGTDALNGISLRIEPLDRDFMSPDIILGSSIAVNGTCLTVTNRDDVSFSVDLAPETLQKTSFTGISSGEEVNLERALKVGDRNSGHTLQGHIDGVGIVKSLVPDGLSIRFTISTAELSTSAIERARMNSLIVPKGFIGLDGASLTVCEVNPEEEWFTLMLIPHTLSVLKKWELNSRINIELDCMAKYISSSMQFMISPLYSQLLRRINALEIMTATACLVSLATVIIAIRR